MSAQPGSTRDSNYFQEFVALVKGSLAQLVRPPSHARRALAARRLTRQTMLALAMVAAAVIALMVALDAREIAMMPPRGTVSLWPVRTLTSFGKDSFVLGVLAAALLALAIALPGLQGRTRARWLAFGTRLQFIFLAVLVPVLAGESIKWMVGRGRPFVGGEANAFNFAPFAGSEAYESFPSGHAVTGFALAFAVSAVWPQTRAAMILYAVLIALSRLVLLAHHPSDVVAGALIGVLGAMLVRYWFAARRMGFAIGRNGQIVPLGAASGRIKGVARGASAP